MRGISGRRRHQSGLEIRLEVINPGPRIAHSTACELPRVNVSLQGGERPHGFVELLAFAVDVGPHRVAGALSRRL